MKFGIGTLAGLLAGAWRRVLRVCAWRQALGNNRSFLLAAPTPDASRCRVTPTSIDYMLKRWPAFTRFLDDGRICMSNNAAERALRGIEQPLGQPPGRRGRLRERLNP